MTNSGFSDYQKLDLIKDLIPIQRDDYFENDANVDSNDKVRQIRAQDFYEDILNFVEGNAKADLKIMNVQEDISFSTLELLPDHKTFKLTSPKGYIDDTVTLTSTDLTSSPLNLETQKDYNEYSYQEIVELNRLLEFYTEKSLFLDANGDEVNLTQIEDAISLLTINLKNQIAPIQSYSPGITVDDGTHILNEINIVVTKLQELRDQLNAVYEATLVSKYVGVVKDIAGGADIGAPQPGEMFIKGRNIVNGELPVTDVLGVRVSKFAYPRYVEDTLDGATPDIIINYLPFDKEGAIFRIGDSDYLIRYDVTNAAITKTDDYFDIDCDAYEVKSGNFEDTVSDTIVGMMVVKTDEHDIQATGYMTVDGEDPLGLDRDNKRRFTSTIYSHGGFRFTESPNGAKVNGVTGVIEFDGVDGIIKKNNNNIVEFKDDKTTINRKVELTNQLVFEDGSSIDTTLARSLTNRAGLKITVDEAHPLALESSSGNGSILDVWTYNASDADNRAKSLTINSNGDVSSAGIIKANTKLVSRYLDSGENSNLNIQHNGNTRIYVGNQYVTINSQGKLNQEGTEDDHLITKKYVDDAVADFAVTGDCIDINGGKLCGGDRGPRWYDLNSWSNDDKNRLTQMRYTPSSLYFWSSTMNKWLYVRLTDTSSNSYNYLKVDESNTLEGDFTFKRSQSKSAPGNTLISFYNRFQVSGNYVYYSDDSYNTASNSTKKTRYSHVWNVYNNTSDVIYGRSTTRVGRFNSWTDYNGTYFCSTKYDDYYNNAWRYYYYFGSHSSFTNSKRYTSTLDVAQGEIPFFSPTGGNQQIGMYFFEGGSSTTFGSAGKIYYFYDDGSSPKIVDVTSKMARVTSNFNGSRSNKTYISTSRGPITRNLLWVHDAPGLEEDESYLFGIFHNGDYPTSSAVDENLTFDVYRTKVKTSQIKDIVWYNVFDADKGGEKVLSGKGFAISMEYIADEIVVEGYVGYRSSSGDPGTPIKVHGDTVICGSINYGDSWDVREVPSGDDRTLTAGWFIKGDYGVFGREGMNPNYLYFYLDERPDIKEGEVYDSDRNISNDSYKNSTIDKGYYKYDFKKPLNEPQELLWNGEPIGMPKFTTYPELPAL